MCGWFSSPTFFYAFFFKVNFFCAFAKVTFINVGFDNQELIAYLNDFHQMINISYNKAKFWAFIKP